MIKKYKQYFVGAIVGGIIVSGGTVFAKTQIPAVLADWIKFEINGQEQTLPSGYTTLIYEGRTYVPARFIAEQLGGTVTWDEKNQTVSIDKKETEPEIKPEIEYEELPISLTKDGVRVEVYDLVRDKAHSRTYVYLRVKNTTEKPIQFDQTPTFLENKGIQYKHADVENTFEKKDKSWYYDIWEDESNEGFVLLPEIDEDIKQGVLHLKIIVNDGSQKEIPFKFNISWK